MGKVSHFESGWRCVNPERLKTARRSYEITVKIERESKENNLGDGWRCCELNSGRNSDSS
jgi:hypothetical protein